MSDVANSSGEQDPVASSPEDTAEPAPWNFFNRILFRFLVVYLVLYSFPFPISQLSSLDQPVLDAGLMENGFMQFYREGLSKFGELSDKSYRWVGSSIFGYEEIPGGRSGSGDRLINYIQLYVNVSLAVMVCLLWSVFDFRRRNYQTLSRYVLIYARYFLAVWMVIYGSFKVVKLQFPDLSMSKMLIPYGESSPMGLVWKFMGHSVAYTSFSGIGEVAGGLLLFFRRTQTLGALVCIGVMANVVMFNYAYDVPVKLFSSHLLLTAMLIAWVDRRRLINVLLLNRNAKPLDLRRPFASGLPLALSRVFKFIFIATVLYANASQAAAFYKQIYPSGPEPPLYGLYDVEKFIMDGEERPPLLTDSSRWHHLLVEETGSAQVQFMVESYEVLRSYQARREMFPSFSFEVDTENKTILMQRRVPLAPPSPGDSEDSEEGQEATDDDADTGEGSASTDEGNGDGATEGDSDAEPAEDGSPTESSDEPPAKGAEGTDESEEKPAPNFTYEQPEERVLILKGELDGHVLVIHLRARDLESMNINRKFRWISDMPYNF